LASSENEARRIRAAENQSLFREVNERVGQLHEGFAVATEIGEWLCECADTACTERITMTVSEYESMRSDSNRFAVAPGHEIPEVETVVDATERYVLVRKIGAGADTARRLDPRS
jgi:hypothetical protein